jgi:Ca2+-binding RTX toxin-like protein
LPQSETTLAQNRNAAEDSGVFSLISLGINMVTRIGTSRGDTLTGGATGDIISGLGGNDRLLGLAGADFLFGGAGNDQLDGGTGADTMVGGIGSDAYIVNSLADRIVEIGAAIGGSDSVTASVLVDLRQSIWRGVETLIYTGAAGVTLHASGLGNRVESRIAGNVTIMGGIGADTLVGGAGVDRLVGGAANDVYIVGAGDVVVEALNAGIDRIVGNVRTINIGAAATTIEQLVYTGTSARLTGNTLANLIVGGAGGDTIAGGALADVLAGGAGRDSIYGGAGNDVLAGGGYRDGLIPGFTADMSVDRLYGGTGNDTFLYTGAGDVFVETATGGTLDRVRATVDASLASFVNIEVLILAGAAVTGMGSARSDIIIGSDGSNLLTGGAGHDTLAGTTLGFRLQEDTLLGGAGNDVLLSLSGLIAGDQYTDSFMAGGAGNDTYLVSGFGAISGFDSAGTDTVIVWGDGDLQDMRGIERIVISGAMEAANTIVNAAIAKIWQITFGLTLTALPDVSFTALMANDDATRIIGNDFQNTIFALGGNDTVLGGFGRDYIDGGAGNDLIAGNTDTLTVENNILDVLYGGGGNDTLVASYAVVSPDVIHNTGYGATMSGDAPDGFSGNDTFRFIDVPLRLAHEITELSGDFILTDAPLVQDFNFGNDTIQLDGATIGDGDNTIDATTTILNPGDNFNAVDELVIIRPNAPTDFIFANYVDVSDAIATIGSAGSDFTPGDRKIIVIDDGTNSAILQFVESGDPSAITSDELFLVAVLANTTNLTAADFQLI